MGVPFFYDEAARELEERTGHSIEDFMCEDYFISRGLVDENDEDEYDEEEEDDE